MKNKKAFTLVELLAVIVILAVILVIAVPQVLDVIDTTKVGSLESSAKLIANSAEKKYAEFLALGKDTSTINCSDVTKLNHNDYGTCTISFDENGKATVSIKGKDDGKFDGLKCEGTKDNMVCGDIPPFPVINCSFDGDLVQGATYVNGQYTYTYKERFIIGYNDYGYRESWSVTLTDKQSTDPVTSKLCTYINDEPVVSMIDMFKNSRAESIDLSSFNTSNVTNMDSMFYNSAATSLDLSSFDTSKVTNMHDMFYGSAVINLDLSNFDTSNVTDMGGMFMQCNAKNIDLSNFDTSNVISMAAMFYFSDVTSLDLSNFDTSKVTNVDWMFTGSKVITGYARTQADADKFNSSSNKPSTLTFVVKGS